MSDESKSKSSEPPPEPEEADDKSSPPDLDGDDSSSKPDEEEASTVERISIELEPMPSEPSPPSRPPPRKSEPPPPGTGRELPKPAYKSAVPPAPKDVPSNIPPRKFPPEVVGDVMTRKIIALVEGDTVENIETGMKRFRFNHLPVVSPENRLVGLVSHRDFLRALAEGIRPADGDDDAEPESVDGQTPVGRIMRRNVITTRADTDIITAGKAMLTQKIGCLPVIEEDNTLVGIVTATDYQKLAIELLDRQQPAKRRDRKD